MFSDLFSFLDYSMGSGYSAFIIMKWVQPIILPSFVLIFMSYWSSPNLLESFFSSFSKLFWLGVPSESKRWAGLVHLLNSLFFILLIFNLTGIFPYCGSLSANLWVVVSLALPFWLATVGLHLTVNLFAVFYKSIRRGSNSAVNAMIMMAETTSFLARPLLLTLRLMVNILIGQLLVYSLTSLGSGVFNPFFMSAAQEGWAQKFIMDLSFLKSLGAVDDMLKGVFSWVLYSFSRGVIYVLVIPIYAMAVGSLLLVECGVVSIQASIFTALVAFYAAEAPVSYVISKGVEEKVVSLQTAKDG